MNFYRCRSCGDSPGSFRGNTELFALVFLMAFAIREPLLADVPSSKEQQLIVACYNVDVSAVVHLIRDGANPRCKYGVGNPLLLRDPWMLYGMYSPESCTPLRALAAASRYPPPPRRIENTEADIRWASEQLERIPSEAIRQRQLDSQIIGLVLISHGVSVNDRFALGSTVLSEAIGNDNYPLAETLIRYGADVNARMGQGIDGPSGESLLHLSVDSVEMTKLLVENGADPNIRDSDGRTPLDVAKLIDQVDVVRLYEQFMTKEKGGQGGRP